MGITKRTTMDQTTGEKEKLVNCNIVNVPQQTKNRLWRALALGESV